jgi:hypothetical protein
MKGDIALAGFVLTAEEWDEMDPYSRAQLIAAANRRDDAWIISAISGAISGPISDGSATSGGIKDT